MGTFVSIIFFSLVVIVQPYRRFDLNVLAMASNLIQVCAFFAALLIKLHDDFNFYWTAEGTARVLGYSTTDDLAILMAVFCFCFFALVRVAMLGRTKEYTFRVPIRLISHDDGTLASNVTFVSDIEGNWEYFEHFVRISAALSFVTGEPVFDDEGAANVSLADGWMFVSGGDTCDKGNSVGGSVRAVRTLCRLKRKYPDRVVLLLGNRDLNKLRLMSELDTSSKYFSRQQVQGPSWVPPSKRIDPELFLRRMVSKRLECEPEDVPDDEVDAADTLPNRIRWIYKETMGADGEFDRQWAEQALLRKVTKGELSEAQVAQAIVKSVCPGGCMRDLLELGQLGFIFRDTLFVHGGLVGGPWVGARDGVDCYGFVPGKDESLIEDARSWIKALNEWKQAQMTEWLEHPFWKDPEMPGGSPTRAASAIIDYVVPDCVPSVVMGRQLDKKGMPQPLPAELVAKLNRNGINKLAVGHTPHGNAPTLLHSEAMLLVMVDTSFSDISAPDQRGAAVCEVQFLKDGSVHVHGVLDDRRPVEFSVPSSCQVGCLLPALPVPQLGVGERDSGGAAMLEEAILVKLSERPHIIKAWLPEEQMYLLCNHEGFVVSYLTLGATEVARLLWSPATRHTA
eukprot:5597000-Prymnesium_polylepis.1